MEILVLLIVVAAVGFVAFKARSAKAPAEEAAPLSPTVVPIPKPVPETAPTPETFTATYNGVGDPPSQEAWAAWLATLDPMRRSFYPATWKQTAPQPGGGGDKFPAFALISGSLVTDLVLARGERALATGILDTVQSFPVEPGATRVTISETSGTGDRVQYNLWISETPAGTPTDGVPSHPFQYNSATVIFTPSERVLYANVRALVEGGRPFYIQAN